MRLGMSAVVVCFFDFAFLVGFFDLVGKVLLDGVDIDLPS